jgi:PEP-CTERM motif
MNFMLRSAFVPFIGAVFSTLLLTAAPHAWAASLNAELLTNGDAEIGTTTGWTTTGVEVISTSVTGQLGLPSGTSIGQWSFGGGAGSAASQALTQLVDISDLSSIVESGAGRYSFSILVQSRRVGITDSASGQLRFLDATGSLISGLSFTDRSVQNNVLDWDQITLSSVLPTATRSIEVFLNTSRTAGNSTDAYFDNASLSISAVPEPDTLALMLLGGLLVASRSRAKERENRIDSRHMP